MPPYVPVLSELIAYAVFAALWRWGPKRDAAKRSGPATQAVLLLAWDNRNVRIAAAAAAALFIFWVPRVTLCVRSIAESQSPIGKSELIAHELGPNPLGYHIKDEPFVGDQHLPDAREQELHQDELLEYGFARPKHSAAEAIEPSIVSQGPDPPPREAMAAAAVEGVADVGGLAKRVVTSTYYRWANPIAENPRRPDESYLWYYRWPLIYLTLLLWPLTDLFIPWRAVYASRAWYWCVYVPCGLLSIATIAVIAVRPDLSPFNHLDRLTPFFQSPFFGPYVLCNAAWTGQLVALYVTHPEERAPLRRFFCCLLAAPTVLYLLYKVLHALPNSWPWFRQSWEVVFDYTMLPAWHASEYRPFWAVSWLFSCYLATWMTTMLLRAFVGRRPVLWLLGWTLGLLLAATSLLILVNDSLGAILLIQSTPLLVFGGLIAFYTAHDSRPFETAEYVPPIFAVIFPIVFWPTKGAHVGEDVRPAEQDRTWPHLEDEAEAARIRAGIREREALRREEERFERRRKSR